MAHGCEQHHLATKSVTCVTLVQPFLFFTCWQCRAMDCTGYWLLRNSDRPRESVEAELSGFLADLSLKSLEWSVEILCRFQRQQRRRGLGRARPAGRRTALTSTSRPGHVSCTACHSRRHLYAICNPEDDEDEEEAPKQNHSRAIAASRHAAARKPVATYPQEKDGRCSEDDAGTSAHSGACGIFHSRRAVLNCFSGRCCRCCCCCPTVMFAGRV